MSVMETGADQSSSSDASVPVGVNAESESSARTAGNGSVGAESEAARLNGAPDTASSAVLADGSMTITFKLYATLQDLLPRGAVKNAVQIEVATDTTLYEIIDRYQVPRELAHLVLINGVFFCDADRNAKGLLNPGDVLAIWPPVAGG